MGSHSYPVGIEWTADVLYTFGGDRESFTSHFSILQVAVMFVRFFRDVCIL